MDDQPALVTHHAILIGINAYPKEALKGCVRDVREIEEYLKQEHPSWMPKPPEIQKFTASSTGNSDSSHPVRDLELPSLFESPELWPTYDNVTTSLKRILSRAKAGDFVYIHFSGHGTTIPSFNGCARDLALVLLEGETGTNLRYLKGLELASLIGDIVHKGMLVTLVLDCCFSGSVMRDDSTTRCLSYDPKVDAAYDLVPESGLEIRANDPAYRNASMRPNWLINPKGYTILTACGPTEKAKEICIEKEQRHGALSYFLLRSLQKYGNNRESQQEIYDYLRTRFKETRGQGKNEQNPNLYGNKFLSFFGPVKPETCSARVLIIQKLDGSLQFQLGAGRAHNICAGDQFALYPRSLIDPGSTSKSNPVIGTITQVGALVSDFELSDPSIQVQASWIATMQSQRSLLTLLVRLDSSVPCQNELLTALRVRLLHAIADQTKELASFYIRLSTEKEYEVFDESDSKLTNLPTMMHEQTDTSRICDVIEHLAKFKLIRDLVNKEPTKSFQETFKVSLNLSGKIFQPESLVHVKHNGPGLKLEMENNGKNNLYFYVYDLRPSWQVKNILSANHKVIPPGKDSRPELRMTVPDELSEKGKKEYRQCNDIIKVFVTAQLTSFDLLELPKLGLPKVDESATKSLTSGINRKGGGSLSEDWAALNFYICTYIDDVLEIETDSKPVN